MTDEVSRSGRPYQPVTHTKCLSSRIPAVRLVSDLGFTYDGPYDQWTFEAKPYGDLWAYPLTSLWSTAVENQLAQADWTSSLIGLSHAVKGLVDSKSLLAVTLKELPQTVQMVCNPFSVFKKDWRKLAGKHTAAELARKRVRLWNPISTRNKPIANKVRIGANSFLEYQYGWNATLVDFKNFAKSTVKYISSTEQYRERHAERFGNRSVVSVPPLDPTIADSTWNASRATIANGGDPGLANAFRIVFGAGMRASAVTCLCTDVLSRPISQIHKLLYAYGLSYEQILGSIWEAIPYSFVVDWFVNTNNMFNALQYSKAVETLSSAAVSNLGHSIKIAYPFYLQYLHHRVGTYWSSKWATLNTKPIGNNPIVGDPGYVTKYVRYSGFPSFATPSFWSGGGLSVSQGASGFSLLFQRLFRR